MWIIRYFLAFPHFESPLLIRRTDYFSPFVKRVLSLRRPDGFNSHTANIRACSQFGESDPLLLSRVPLERYLVSCGNEINNCCGTWCHRPSDHPEKVYSLWCRQHWCVYIYAQPMDWHRTIEHKTNEPECRGGVVTQDTTLFTSLTSRHVSGSDIQHIILPPSNKPVLQSVRMLTVVNLSFRWHSCINTFETFNLEPNYFMLNSKGINLVLYDV